MKDKKPNSIREWIIKLILVLYDAFVVNIAFFMALIVRFYLNGSFSEIGLGYLPDFFKFAPYYTVCSIIIFFVFHMYDMVWRAAGLDDLKRILVANICTCIVQVAGTLAFTRRMPITYYVIGMVIQVVMVCLIRFIPRMLFFEGIQGKNTKDSVPSMIVGIGDNTIILQDKMRRNQVGKKKAVCILDYSYESGGNKLFNGLPIIQGIENMGTAIQKYAIGYVFIAERSLRDETYERISSICDEMGVELRDFTIDTEQRYGKITLFELMKVITGKVKVIDEGKEQQFEDGIQACKAMDGSTFVKKVEAENGLLTVSIEKNHVSNTQDNSNWMQKYEEEYNEEVTFF